MRARTVLWIPVLAATAAMAWIVPENPLRHLDDPSHWGVLVYLIALVLLGRRAAHGMPRRTLAFFLLAMPLVYVANWWRHGGSPGWLTVELLGLTIFGAIAWLGRYRSAWWLALGISLHALWDLSHLETAAFVPAWYATACAVIDIAIGGYAAAVCADSDHGVHS